jgi:peptidoglycan/xylan/chitin deacetylase (PgdA/CDA1 family)
MNIHIRNSMCTYLILSFLIFFTSLTFSQDKSGINNINLAYKVQDTGDITIKKWKDDKTAAFSFTFDDCLHSQYAHVFPIFQQFGFEGTFYVIVGSLKDSNPDWLYGTWPEFIAMSDAGQEIGSHTMTHPHLGDLPIGDSLTQGTLIYELYQSKKIIQQRIPDKHCIGLAYPYSEYDNDVILYTSMYYEVARAISVNPVDSTLSGEEWFKIGSRVINFDMPRDSLYNDLDELQDFIDYVQDAITQGKWGLLQAHDVLPYDSIAIAISLGSYEPISVPWFTAACDSIYKYEQNGDLWVAPVRDITRYMKERESFGYTIASVNDTSILINVTDTLDDNLYNFPLTADIVVPNDWTTVSVFQGSFYDYTSPYPSGGNNIIETSVIPDGGQVRLCKGYISGIKDIAQTNPGEFRLYQNYPNPFNPTTIISFSIPEDANTVLKVFNSLGEEVAVPINGYLLKGLHKINFDGSKLSSGIYFYRVISGNYQGTKKMILLQ